MTILIHRGCLERGYKVQTWLRTKEIFFFTSGVTSVFWRRISYSHGEAQTSAVNQHCSTESEVIPTVQTQEPINESACF